MRATKTLLLIVALAALGGRAWGSELEERIPIQPGGTLRVELPTGSIEVDSHDDALVEIDARGSGWRDVDFDLTHDADEVRLIGVRRGWLPGLGRARVRVHIRVPERFHVDLATGGGRIDVQELIGRVRAETRGGGIELDRIEGDVGVETSGGSIRAREIRGSLEARTSGGSIHVSEVSGAVEARTSGGGIRIREAGDEVRARTSGGSVEVRFSGPPRGRLQTSGGSIDVELPVDAGLELRARTSGGRVVIDEAFRVDGRVAGSEAEASINGGGARLDVRTSGGSIQVRPR